MGAGGKGARQRPIEHGRVLGILSGHKNIKGFPANGGCLRNASAKARMSATLWPTSGLPRIAEPQEKFSSS